MNRIVHFEFNTPDTAKTNEFFKAVFGWQIDTWAGGDFEYFMASSGDDKSPGINGGIMASQDGQPRTVNTIGVESLDAMMETVKQHGGQVVVEKFPITGVGYAAHCLDPAGVLFGIYQPDESAKA